MNFLRTQRALKKHIFLLIGPKGSGKTFIGTLIQEYFNIDFVRVEDRVTNVRKERNLDDPEYISDAFYIIEEGVRNALENVDQIVFESTGITLNFDLMLSSLKQDFKVTTIKIIAEPEICMDRVRTRDQSMHINVSDEKVKEINAAVELKRFRADYSIENSNKMLKDLLMEIRKIMEITNTTPTS